MEHIRRGYLEDFIRESNSSLIEELNVRSLEDLLVSEEVAEEKDEGIHQIYPLIFHNLNLWNIARFNFVTVLKYFQLDVIK